MYIIYVIFTSRIYLVMLFSDAELLDPCDTDLDSDDSLDDELETLDELDEVLECFDWESSTLLTSPHSRRCLICVICLSSLAILIFWSLITFLTSESFLSERTFRRGPVISKKNICIMHQNDGGRYFKSLDIL